MRRFSLLLVVPLLVVIAGCGPAPEPGPGEDIGQTSAAISRSNVISRAMEWVDAKLQYCQAAYHQHDYDTACSSICNRQENPAWDPYRSDCSGFVSWAWGLPAPGRVTTGFAPFNTAVSHTINGSNLAPGDALNNSEHIVLFKGWVTKGSKADLLEEPGCSFVGHAHEFTSNVTISGSSVYISYEGNSFTAIRYNNITDAAWGAGFVSQSFPYASQGAIQMVVGQTVSESITLKNTGTKSWNGKTKLTPTPRDKASSFADSSWLSPTRIVAAGSVAPGGKHKFTFKLHATKAGTFNQYFGMVQEGVAWFSDPGQGGPPDDQLQAKIVVSKPDYGAKVLSTSFPAAGQALVMTPGQTVTVDISLENVGTKNWSSSTRIGTTGPRDRTSPFADSSWIAPNRPAGAAGTVTPGTSYDFSFVLRAPQQLGSYVEHYGVVQEAVAWFSDPGQGGPADDEIVLPIDVVAPGTTDAGTTPWDGGSEAGFGADGGGLPGDDAGAGLPADDAGAAGASGEQSHTLVGNSGSCSVGAPGGSSSTGGFPALGLLGLSLVFFRRRRR